MIERRIAVKALPLGLLAGLFNLPSSSAATFTDVPNSHPFYREIMWATDNDYITGGAGGKFHPRIGIDRKTLATVFYNYWGQPTYTPPTQSYFTDVTRSHPQYKEISWCVRKNLINGWSDHTFRPDLLVERDAMATFLYRLAGHPYYTPPAQPKFTDVPLENLFYKEVCWLYDMGITTGYPDGNFFPKQPVERGAVCVFLYRMSQIFG